MDGELQVLRGMYPHIGLPIASLLLLLSTVVLIRRPYVIFSIFWHLMLFFHMMTFVDSDHHHLVVLYACFKHVVKCQYLALFGYLDETETALREIELHEDLKNFLRSVG